MNKVLLIEPKQGGELMIIEHLIKNLTGLCFVGMVLEQSGVNIFPSRFQRRFFFQKLIMNARFKVLVRRQAIRIDVAWFNESFGFLFTGAGVALIHQTALPVHKTEQVFSGAGQLLTIVGAYLNAMDNRDVKVLNHYVRHDGKKAIVRAVAFTDKNEEGKVDSVRLYMDTSPVFA